MDPSSIPENDWQVKFGSGVAVQCSCTLFLRCRTLRRNLLIVYVGFWFLNPHKDWYVAINAC